MARTRKKVLTRDEYRAKMFKDVFFNAELTDYNFCTGNIDRGQKDQKKRDFQGMPTVSLPKLNSKM